MYHLPSSNTLQMISPTPRASVSPLGQGLQTSEIFRCKFSPESQTQSYGLDIVAELKALSPSVNAWQFIALVHSVGWYLILIVSAHTVVVTKYFSCHAWSQHIKVNMPQMGLCGYSHSSQSAAHRKFLRQLTPLPSTPLPKQETFAPLLLFPYPHLYPVIMSGCSLSRYSPLPGIVKTLVHTLSSLIWPPI